MWGRNNMDIGIIGYGGVSKAFITILADKEEYLKEKYNLTIRVKYIIKSDGGLYHSEGLNLKEISNMQQPIQLHRYWSKININDIISSHDVDTIVELTNTNIETGEPGLTHIKKALNNKINVVTGNKGPILLKYKELKAIADDKEVKLMVGCTTGGALPTIMAGIYDIAGAEIKYIEGILNGTTNYILSEMTDNYLDYEEALLKAQSMGIAELDPSLDVEGYDTACKIIILANVLFNKELKLADVNIEGITNVSKDYLRELKASSRKLKLIGRIDNERGLKAEVKLEEINSEHPLYSVDYKNKGIYYNTDTLGEISVIGGASGTINAAASILRDIIMI